MKTLRDTEALRRILVKLGYLLAAGIGLKYGFDFGDKLAGTPLGVLMALNAAVFGALLFGVVAGLLLRPAITDGKKP